MESPQSSENGSTKPIFGGKKVSPIAIAILQKIERGETNPDSLSCEHRRICIEYLLQTGSYSQYQICQVLNIDRKTVYNHKKKIREGNELASLVIDEAEYAQNLIEWADTYASELSRAGKKKDAWTVRKECLETLQSMGFIKKVQPDLNLKGQISILEVLEFGSKQRDEEFSRRSGEPLMEQSEQIF